MSEERRGFHIGVDIGGTFTDLVAVDADGVTHRSKAPTTPDDYSSGIVDGLERLAGEVGVPLEELMSRTELFINGTTIVTNVIAELRGRRVGVLITRGFGDTLRIARSARTNDLDLHTQTPPPDFVDRNDILEIDERIDWAGDVVVPLHEDQVHEAARELVQRGCEALAICFLWSFQNPSHEQRAKEIVTAAHPDVFISVSSDVFPVAREYERLVTTGLNAFASRGVDDYVSKLERELDRLGCPVQASLMQSIGGLITPQAARELPIQLLNSGPVGGVTGARAVGERLGIKDIITADMGGTSFDSALVTGGEVAIAHRAEIGRFETGISMVDISAIGAGGGSILWVDQRGAPRVGPDSAGAVPGPACYGRGGTKPTVTDAAVAMGLIDPDYFLGGQIKLDRDAAVQAVRRHVAEPLEWGLDRTLTGMHAIVTDTMANSVRAISIQKGHDPRGFTMLGFGGASGLFLPLICRTMGIAELLIPASAAVFSAYGLLWADRVRSFVQTVNWIVPASPLEALNAVLADLSEKARHAFGEAEGPVQITYEGDFKFAGQAFEVTVPLPGGELEDAHREQLAATFTEDYERLYGPGTAWEGFPVLMLNLRVTASCEVRRPTLQTFPVNGSDPERALHERREVLEPVSGERLQVPVYRGAQMTPGMSLAGPAIIEDVDTTLYLPADASCRMDEYGNYRIAV
jgi:N-methylhydantoinase A